MFVVKLEDRKRDTVHYRVGEPGLGGVSFHVAGAQKFDTRAEAEAYVGRLITVRPKLVRAQVDVIIEELPEPTGTVSLEVSRKTAQWLRNLLGYVVWDEHYGEVVSQLDGFNYQPSQFDCSTDGIRCR